MASATKIVKLIEGVTPFMPAVTTGHTRRWTGHTRRGTGQGLTGMPRSVLKESFVELIMLLELTDLELNLSTYKFTYYLSPIAVRDIDTRAR